MTLSESDAVVIINSVPHAPGIEAVSFGWQSRHNQREANSPRDPQAAGFGSGQVAQVVERSPEKAGVGGSTPSLATIFSISYIILLSNYFRREGTRIVGWSGNLGRPDRSRHLKPHQLDSGNRVGAERSFQALCALSRAIFRVNSCY